MNDLFLYLDDYVAYLHKQNINQKSRKIAQMYQVCPMVKNPRRVLKLMDPTRFMFTEIGVYKSHIKVMKKIAEIGKINLSKMYKNIVEDPDIHEWLEFYLNPKFSSNNISIDECKIILAQIKKWYLTDDNLHGCCLLKYHEKIKNILLRSMSVDFINIYNGMVKEYKGERCSRCKSINENLLSI